MSAPTPSGGAPRRILVTGGCGYVGSRLLRDLPNDPAFAGCHLRIIDNLLRGGHLALSDLPGGSSVEFLEGDILDPAAVDQALDDVDSVVHLAALTGTPINFHNPHGSAQVNHWGTTRLVDACVVAGVRQLVFASTTAVYGPGGPFSEASPCRPLGWYAQSKLDAEAAVRAAEDRGLQVTVLRLGTVFGHAPGVRFDTVANRFAFLAAVGRSLTVFGTGEQRRPLVHVRDASDAVRFSLRKPAACAGQTFNVQSDNPSVLDIVEAVRLIEPGVRVRFTEQDILTHLSLEVEAARIAEAGWQPQFTVREGMEELLSHFRGIRSLSTPGIGRPGDFG